VLVTLLVIPSTAYAAALKFTGIEGTSTNKADVTTAGQLEVAPAGPGSYFADAYGFSSGGDTLAVVATPPAGDALIVQTVHLDISLFGSGVYLYLGVQTGASCSGSQVGSYDEGFTPQSAGDIDVPLEPGVVVPAGDSLCLRAFGTVDVSPSATGYTVPSSEVPAEAISPLPARPAAP
jgi:hypothetical protein